MKGRVLLVLLIFLFVLPAFGRGAPEPAAVEGEIGGTITYWTFLDPEDTGPRSVVQQQLVAEFEAQYGVQVDVIRKHWADIASDLIRAAAGRIAPDVARVQTPKDFLLLLGADAFEPLDKYITFSEADKQDWLLGWELGERDGVKYTVPIEHRFVTLWANPDLLDLVGADMPTTWAELNETAAQLSDMGYIGYVVSLSKATEVNSLMEYFDAAYRDLGKSPVDRDGFVTWGDSDEAVKVMENLKMMYQSGAIPAEVAAWDVDDAHRAFQAGRVAFMNYGTQRVSTTRAAGQEVLIGALPTFERGQIAPSYTSGWHLAIGRGSTNPYTAAEFIRFMTSTEAQKLNAIKAQEMPSRISAYDDPWFDQDPLGQEMREWGELLNEVGGIFDFHEDWLEMRHALADAAQEIILDNAPIRATLKKYADAFNEGRR